MKFYINYILILIFFSCDFTSNKELVVEDLVSNDLKTFNWNDVDTYPRFQNCDTIINKESNFDCSYNIFNPLFILFLTILSFSIFLILLSTYLKYFP